MLTLAVVDDLLAITVIALFYTEHINITALVVAIIPLSLFALAVQRRIRSWWLLVPLAVLTWLAVHESGEHATVAGVLLGLCVPVLRSPAGGGRKPAPGLAEHFEHRMRPISAAVAVPLFAFFAAGVNVGGLHGVNQALQDPVAMGVIGGLVVGKPLGVYATARVLAALTRATLDAALRWIDVFGVALLAGIGFTVALLIGELAYGIDSPRNDHVKIGVLTGSVIAAVIASIVLRLRNRHYRTVCAEEARDDDSDDVPDLHTPSDIASPPTESDTHRRAR